MSAPPIPPAVEDRLTMLETAVARLTQQLERIASPNTCGVGILGGSAADLPAEVWEEFQKCCREARKEIDGGADYES